METIDQKIVRLTKEISDEQLASVFRSKEFDLSKNDILVTIKTSNTTELEKDKELQLKIEFLIDSKDVLKFASIEELNQSFKENGINIIAIDRNENDIYFKMGEDNTYIKINDEYKPEYYSNINVPFEELLKEHKTFDLVNAKLIKEILREEFEKGVAFTKEEIDEKITKAYVDINLVDPENKWGIEYNNNIVLDLKVEFFKNMNPVDTNAAINRMDEMFVEQEAKLKENENNNILGR